MPQVENTVGLPLKKTAAEMPQLDAEMTHLSSIRMFGTIIKT
jgi:hypothetical protein